MQSNYHDIENLKLALKGAFDRLTQIRLIAEYLLDYLKATSISTSKSSNELWDEYEKLKSQFPDFIPDIPKNTFVITLSKVSNEQGSKVNCPGKKQGYYLEQLVEKLEAIGETERKAEDAKEALSESIPDQFQEKNMYSILKDWLFEKDYDRVADTSSLRANGKWGNPDLVGLKIEDIYGRPDIEITTIEVKLTEDNWEQWIFEAVAHTRFSNRSYFAFLYPENLFNKLDSTDLKLYAEHFGIGILIIEIDGLDYLKVKEKKSVFMNLEKLRIIEYFQAPYTQTHIKFRKKFLKSLDILELNKLYRFGEELQ